MRYDVAVIGAGPGGYVAAIRLAQSGKKVICIDKRSTLGGTCLNVGCIPSKALLHSSEMFFFPKLHAKENGILFKEMAIDFKQMMQRKQSIVNSFTKGIDGLFRKNRIDFCEGTASFIDAHKLQVQQAEKTDTIEANTIIIATGSEVTPLAGVSIDEKKILSSTGALSLEEIPSSIVIVGAGIIGVELGSVLARLGSKVQFLEFCEQITPNFDRDLSEALQKSLEKQGMQFFLKHQVQRIDKKDNELQIEALYQEKPRSFASEKVLIAVGRRPYTEKLQLEKIGVQTDAKGFVLVNERFQSSVENIYAIGDVINGPMLAHKASQEGICLAESLLSQAEPIVYPCIPSVAYTYPELAATGLSEGFLQKKAIAYRKGKASFQVNSRSKCTDETEGFVKVLIQKETTQILGVQILGAKASEMIAVATLAVQKKLTAKEFLQLTTAHPTLSESISEAIRAAQGAAIHF